MLEGVWFNSNFHPFPNKLSENLRGKRQISPVDHPRVDHGRLGARARGERLGALPAGDLDFISVIFCEIELDENLEQIMRERGARDWAPFQPETWVFFEGGFILNFIGGKYEAKRGHRSFQLQKRESREMF